MGQAYKRDSSMYMTGRIDQKLEKMVLTVATVLLVSMVTVNAYNKEIMEMYLSPSTGEAVYYGKSDDGTCQFGPSLPAVATSSHIKYLVGLNSKQMQGSIACGMCLRIRATGEGEGGTPVSGDFVAFVNNDCDSCHEGGIDIADDGDGHWGIEMEAIQCPVEDTKIEYRFEGSSEWYLRMQVRNTRVPVQMVHIERDGAEVEMTRTSDGFWELGEGKVETPINIKLTAVTDEVVSDVISAIENEVILQGEHAVQFEFDWNLPGKK